jgi:hypothetical protein
MMSRSKLMRVAVFAAITFGAAYGVMRGEQCYIPSSSTHFCIDTKDVLPGMTLAASCSTYNGLPNLCAGSYTVLERKQFPNGPTPHSTGATKEVEAECWNAKLCDYDYDTSTCVAQDLGPWTPGDKTVVNSEVQCPAGS